MRHDAHGWWIADAGPPPPLAPLETDTSADVVVIGGGYTGMWAAWHVLAAAPDARVVLLEAGGCGLGPSGRNGGFVSPLGLSRPPPDRGVRGRARRRARHGVGGQRARHRRLL